MVKKGIMFSIISILFFTLVTSLWALSQEQVTQTQNHYATLLELQKEKDIQIQIQNVFFQTLEISPHIKTFNETTNIFFEDFSDLSNKATKLLNFQAFIEGPYAEIRNKEITLTNINPIIHIQDLSVITFNPSETTITISEDLEAISFDIISENMLNSFFYGPGEDPLGPVITINFFQPNGVLYESFNFNVDLQGYSEIMVEGSPIGTVIYIEIDENILTIWSNENPNIKNMLFSYSGNENAKVYSPFEYNGNVIIR
ncbi:MAG: hypothetical protein ACMXYK_05050 [Candidatus Woesearchaeota archaeon]